MLEQVSHIYSHDALSLSSFSPQTMEPPTMVAFKHGALVVGLGDPYSPSECLNRWYPMSLWFPLHLLLWIKSFTKMEPPNHGTIQVPMIVCQIVGPLQPQWVLRPIANARSCIQVSSHSWILQEEIIVHWSVLTWFHGTPPHPFSLPHYKGDLKSCNEEEDSWVQQQQVQACKDPTT